MRRKGYMYAIEGVIASLLVIIYIGSMISTPTPIEWSKTSISKRSGDFMSSLSRTGWLDSAVSRDDPEVIGGIAESMDLGMSYSMYVSGVPSSRLSVSLLMNSSEIHRSSSRVNSSLDSGDGLPASESGYRSGEILGTAFVLSDINEDGQTVYNAVNFDLNGNGDFDDQVDGVREGPYLFGDIINTCLGERCSKFSVGYMDNTLTLYDMESYGRLAERNSVEAGPFRTEISYRAEELRPKIKKDGSEFTKDGLNWTATEEMEGVDIGIIVVGNQNESVRFNISSEITEPYFEGDSLSLLGELYNIESTMPFKAVPNSRIESKALIAKDVDPAVLDRENDTIRSFLSQGNVLVEMLDLRDWDIGRFEDSIQPELGLRWRDVDIDKGSGINQFSKGDLGQSARKYYSSIDIALSRSRYEFHPDRDNPEYAVANMSLRGQNVTVNSSMDGSVDIYTEESSEENLQKGDMASVAGNIYRVKEVFPLELSPSEGYSFRNFYGGKVVGDTSVLSVSGWRWNKSSGSFNVSLGPVDRPEGAPDSSCSSNKDYFIGSFDFRGESHDLLATNRSPCEDDLDYVNFDFNDNGRFDDEEVETGVGYSSEGIYQNGQEVLIDGAEFRVRADGPNWVYLERQAGGKVGSLVHSSGVYQGNGKVFFSGNPEIGNDDASLLEAVLMRSSADRHRFTNTLSIGSSSSGLTYTGNIRGEFSTPYTIDSAWWFQ